MKARENAEFEKEEKERKSHERRCNNSLCQKNLRLFESAQKKEEKQKKEAKRKATKHLLEFLEVRDERLQKDAKVKAAKHLLQSPEVREERLQKDAPKSTVEPQPVYNGHPWEFRPTKVLRQVLLYYSFFFPLFTSMFDKRLPHQQNITIKLKMHTGYVLYVHSCSINVCLSDYSPAQYSQGFAALFSLFSVSFFSSHSLSILSSIML